MTERNARLAKSLPDKSAVVLGDSIAARWPKDQLASLLGEPVVVLANGGDRIEHTNWTLTQLDPASAMTARRVVSEVGTANLLTDTACEFSVRMQAYLRNLRRAFPNATIYALNIYQKGPGGRARVAQVSEANATIRKAASQNNIVYVDLHDPMAQKCAGQENCMLLEPNRVHPSAAGYDLFSIVLRSAIAR